MTFTTPQQPASAVVARLLISLGVLGLGAAAFRLSLRPVPGASAAASGVFRTFTQHDALNGAKQLHVDLDAGNLDLKVGAADLPGEALRGQLTLAGTLERRAERAGDLLTLSYTARQRIGLTGVPALRLDARGVQLGGWNGGLSAPWELQLGRALPTSLRVQLLSGDTQLHLADAALTDLHLTSQAGDLKASLPARLPGDVALNSGAGNLTASFLGSAPAGAAGSFSSASRSGDQRLDLTKSAFGRVRIESGSGDVWASLPDRPGVNSEVKVVAGDIHLTLGARANSGSLTVTGVGGDLSLTVPPGLPVRLRMQRAVGDLHSPPGWVSGGGLSRSPAVREGQPALEVTLLSVVGDVTIQEAKP